MISEPLLEKFDALFREKYRKQMTRQELVDAVDSLIHYFEQLTKMNFEQEQQAENNKQYANNN